MKHVFVIVSIFVMTGRLNAQELPEQASTMIGQGILKMEIAMKEWDKNEMLSAKADFERAGAMAAESSLPLYWKAYADYRLTIYCLYMHEMARDEEAAKRFIEEAIGALENAVRINPQDAESYALLGTLTGMKISFNPVSAMWLGPQSNEYYSKALSCDNKNPRVYLSMAIGTYNKPAMFGGGADKAIPQLEQAILLFEGEAKENSEKSIKPRWGFDECYSWLGMAYEKVDKKDQAKVSFEQALKLNPNSKRAQMGLAKLGK